MRRAAYLILLGAFLLVWIVSPLGLYAALSLILLGVISAAENFLAAGEVSASTVDSIISVGSSPVLGFDTGGKLVRGVVCAENVFTHSVHKQTVRVHHGEKAALDPAVICGGLVFSHEGFVRYDFLGLTRKRVRVSFKGKCAVLPRETALIQLEEIPQGELALSGAKEYVEGDELRHVNFKLTHRFSKIFINTYSPEEKGGACVFFETAYSTDSSHCDKAAERACSVIRQLCMENRAFSLAFYTEEGLFCESVTSADRIMPVLMYAGTHRGSPTFDMFRKSGAADSFGKIIMCGEAAQ
ncbi:MAG: DUF58 domain-containing protein [Ruminococcus sp.]|nr:DUF58 domain-containing protein [Ruminococcus sp.]